jgi:hypothetical protein
VFVEMMRPVRLVRRESSGVSYAARDTPPPVGLLPDASNSLRCAISPLPRHRIPPSVLRSGSRIWTCSNDGCEKSVKRKTQDMVCFLVSRLFVVGIEAVQLLIGRSR